MTWPKRRHVDTPAVRTPPEAVRAGADGAYLVAVGRDGCELAATHYQGSWDLSDGFSNAWSIYMSVTRSGEVAGVVFFESRSGRLVGFIPLLNDVTLQAGGSLHFPPGDLSLIPCVSSEPEPGSWQEAAMRAIEVPRRATPSADGLAASPVPASLDAEEAAEHGHEDHPRQPERAGGQRPHDPEQRLEGPQEQA